MNIDVVGFLDDFQSQSQYIVGGIGKRSHSQFLVSVAVVLRYCPLTYAILHYFGALWCIVKCADPILSGWYSENKAVNLNYLEYHKRTARICDKK